MYECSIHWFTTPKGCNRPDWARIKAGSRVSIQVSYIGGTGLLPVAFPVALARSWIGNTVARIQICSLIWNTGVPNSNLIHCATMPALIIYFRLGKFFLSILWDFFGYEAM